jgi:hypothetical protein
MLWGPLAAGYLLRQQRLLWCACSLPLLATLLATGSRTGVIGLALVALAVLVRSDRMRARAARVWWLLLLAAVPLGWFALSSFTRSMAQAAILQRLALWRDTLEVISQHPALGVGWGQLNFAWTLTSLAHRAPDVFDHAHSLPLHLSAELGLPLTAVVLTLLGVALWRAQSALRTAAGFTIAMLVATALLHSLIEYPLWFSYFLLPTAVLLAWLGAAARSHSLDAIASTQAAPQAARSRGFSAIRACLAAVSLVSLGAVAYAHHEYLKVAAIQKTVGDPAALARAIERARGSRLFGHFGDYAAIMLARDTAAPLLFDRTIRHLFDERLMVAYARMLARTGDLPRAMYVVARAREFPPDAAFSDLPAAPVTAPIAPALTFEDFRR